MKSQVVDDTLIMSPLLCLIMGIPYIAVLSGLMLLSNAWLTILLYHCGMVIVLYMYRSHLRFSFKISHFGWFGAMIMMGTATGVSIFFFWEFAALQEDILKTLMKQFHLQGFSFYAFLVYFILINPLLEELFWRILLNPRKHTFIIDIFFGLYHSLILIYIIHWYFIIPAILCLVFAGMIWRYIHNTYKDDLTIIISHILADVSIVCAVYFLM
ncbi:MAG: CPBP family intramembrane metalloprotease [Spirochaetales bacterium]|nr:CPBP family intramembrane metalloprotease [Spirochaetales bacterium]